ncbi:MAG: DNA ligase (NAD(+)) LigA [Bacteroidetes bacterium]|nr:MAG: DNA ligase (NAD(+)) LigA [Bacteroidota bacterium]
MYSKNEEKALFERSKALLALPDNLSEKEAAAVVDDLIRTITYHEWRYYVLNDPVVSDYEYDLLYKKLEALEKQFPNLRRPDSPTQRVSNDIINTFNTVEHLAPMLSLANSYNAEDLKDFDTQIKKFAMLSDDDVVEYVVEPKFDGGGIALVYENDLLVRAATRGNGVAGEDITPNARTLRSIPLRAAFSERGLHKVELRGEAVIRKDRFKEMNAERENEGLPLFANPRNTATGGLRTKDPNETAKRQIEAFVYQIGYGVDQNGEPALHTFKTHHQTIEFLGGLGFKAPLNETKVCRNIDEAIQFCHEWEQKREAYPYEIDGMVVKVNSLELQERCGYTSHHPRWAMAFKFKAKQATTKLLEVEYQVGKIGSITPVAKVEPVSLAGVTVSSISLHNEDFIRSKDIRLGDTVLIERAGDVIPYIVKPLTDLRDGSEQVIEFPTHCPSCHTPLVREEGEAAWRCPNYDGCEAQILQRLIFHVSKPAMNIDGLGKSIIERFYELGWVKNIADIYRLDYDKIAQLDGFGEKSANNLRQAIERAKKNPIHRLLHSLSIHHLGQKASKLIAAEIDHVLDLQNWTEEDFTRIKDIGPTVAENVIAFFKNEKNIALLKEMESLGVNMRQTEADRPKVVSEDSPLFGKTILFTGTLQTMTRKEAQEKAEAAGAKNVSGVSSKLDILVAGEKAGSKLKKATALGTVQILSEAEFLKIIGQK